VKQLRQPLRHQSRRCDKRRQTGAHALQFVLAQIASGNAGTFFHHLNDLAPGIDQHAVAPGATAIGMVAALGRRQHIALVFNRPRPQQNFPVRAARGVGEGRRHHQQAHSPMARYSSGKRRS
jgi:hypothetical protein